MRKVFLSLMIACAFHLSHAEVWVDPDTGIAWTYTIGSNEFIGGEWDSSVCLSNDGESVVPTDVAGVVKVPAAIKGNPVRIIGSSAFSNCGSITRVEIPETVMAVGGNVFAGCNSLRTVAFKGNAPTCMWYDYQWSDFTICYKEGATGWGDSDLRMWISPVCVPKDGGYTTTVSANEEDESVNRVSYGYVISGFSATITSCKKEGYNSAYGKIVVPSELDNCIVMAIGDGAFSRCELVYSLEIPEGVVSIGREAFKATSFKTIILPKSLKEIGYAAFRESGIEHISIPDGVSDLPRELFYDCWHLESVELGSGFRTWSKYYYLVDNNGAFLQKEGTFVCCSLTNIVVSGSNPQYSSADGCLLSKDGETLLLVPYACEKLRVPEGVRNLGDCCARTPCIGNVEFALSVTNIGPQSLANTGLSSVVIPDNIKSIQNGAFSDSRLNSISFGSGFCYLGYASFFHCTSLRQVKFSGNAPELEWQYPIGSREPMQRGFEGVNASCKCLVSCKTSGWGEVPGIWNGLPTQYFDAEFELILDANGGEPTTQTVVVTNGQRYGVLPTPVRRGYKFDGWYAAQLDSERIDETMVVGDYERLFAHWEPYEYGDEIEETIDGVTWLGLCDGEGGVRILGAVPLADEIIVPSELGGLSVVGLEPYAFAADVDTEGPASVVLPEGILEIGDEAFANCSLLTTITIPSSVEYIGEGAFSGCPSLTLTLNCACPDGYEESGVDGVKGVVYPADLEMYESYALENHISSSYVCLQSALYIVPCKTLQISGWSGQCPIQSEIEFLPKGVDLCVRVWHDWSGDGDIFLPVAINDVVSSYYGDYWVGQLSFDRPFSGYQDSAELVYRSRIYHGVVGTMLDDPYYQSNPIPVEDGDSIVDESVTTIRPGDIVVFHGNDGDLISSDNGSVSGSIEIEGYEISDMCDFYNGYMYVYGLCHNNVFYWKVPRVSDVVTGYGGCLPEYDRAAPYRRFWTTVDKYEWGYDARHGIWCWYSKDSPVKYTILSECPSKCACFKTGGGAVDDVELVQRISLDGPAARPDYGISDPWITTWTTISFNEYSYGNYGNDCLIAKEEGWNVRDGWEFAGWKLSFGRVLDQQGQVVEVGGIVATVQDFVLESDVIFVAQYKPIVYGIIYENYPEALGYELPSTYTTVSGVTFPVVEDFCFGTPGRSPSFHVEGWEVDGEIVKGIPPGSIGDKTVVFKYSPYAFVEEDVMPLVVEYDGTGHVIAVGNTEPRGARLQFSLSENGPYSDSLQFTDVCEDKRVWVKISADGFYPAVFETTVTITPRSIECTNISVESPVSLLNGAQPEVIVVDAGLSSILKKGVDYMVSYADNDSSGNARAIVTGIGNYAGSVEIGYVVTDWSDVKVAISTPIVFYDGAAQCPSVEVRDVKRDVLLQQGVDFAVTYTKNVAVGVATASISGTGAYSGSQEVDFRILPPISDLPRVLITPNSGIRNGRTSVTLNYGGIDGLVSEIRYTVDGRDPTEDSPTASGKMSVTVDGELYLRAAAFVGNLRVSEYAVAHYYSSIADVIVQKGEGCGAVAILSEAPNKWIPDEDVRSSAGRATMRSALNMADSTDDEESSSVMTASFEGDGVIEFSWKASCEWDDWAAADRHDCVFDHVVCILDGEEVAWLDGESEWTKVAVTISTPGVHTLAWKYVKDAGDVDPYPGEDCAWVSDVKFTFAAYVDFASDEPIVGSLPETIVSAAGYSVELPELGDVKYDKHVFAGWRYGETIYQPGDKLIVDRQSITLKPVWLDELVVSFDVGYETQDGPSPIASTMNTEIELPDIGEAHLPCHDFVGWLDSGYLYRAGDAYSVTGNVTLVASWVEKRLEKPVIEVLTEYDEPSTFVTITAGAGVSILYTVDGSDPNEEGVEYNGPFAVSGSVMVRAVATADDFYNSEIAEAETVCVYTPVSVAFSIGEAVGSSPAVIATALRRSFVLPEIGDAHLDKHRFVGWSDGGGVYEPGCECAATGDVTFAAVWEAKKLVAPQIEVPTSYDTEKTTVKIESLNDEGSVRYTIDGTAPSGTSEVYLGPFEVAGTITIRAIAIADDWFDSEIAAATTKRAPWTLGEILNSSDLSFSVDGAEWVRDRDVSHDGVASLRSGKIGDRERTSVSTTVEGEGVISFWYRTSCEAEDGAVFDGLRFYVDGVGTPEDRSDPIGGVMDWTRFSLRITGNGSHTLTWQYEKDRGDYSDVGEDCVWIDDVEWLPGSDAVDLVAIFGADSEVVRQITGSNQIATFVSFVKSCGVVDVAQLNGAQKEYAYKSFKLSEITTAPRLFEEEPVLKIDDLELTGGNLSVTISLTAGAEAIQLAKDKLAEKIRVGSTLGDITGKPVIVASPAADGISLTFTISAPEGNQGFVKVQID